jgi:hypothetical protein
MDTLSQVISVFWRSQGQSDGGVAQFLTKERDFIFSKASNLAHSLGTVDYFTGDKMNGAWVWPLPSCSTVKNMWSHTQWRTGGEVGGFKLPPPPEIPKFWQSRTGLQIKCEMFSVPIPTP